MRAIFKAAKSGGGSGGFAEDATLKARRSGIGYTPAELRNLVVKADRFAGNGDYDQAISYYEVVLRNDPKDADARRSLARARENRAERK